MEGSKECEANLVIYLHPSKANCVNDAIHGELTSVMFTYNETLEGVILAYDPVCCSKLARILPGVEPYFGVRLKAKFIVFNPTPDMLLEGKVVKVTRTAICAEVLGFAWASILDEDIREDFKHCIVKKKRGPEGNSKHAFASQTHKKHMIKFGNTIRFVVKSFDGEMLHITGSMLANNTGNSEWLDRHVGQWSQADRVSNKRIKEDAGDAKSENKNSSKRKRDQD